MQTRLLKMKIINSIAILALLFLLGACSADSDRESAGIAGEIAFTLSTRGENNQLGSEQEEVENRLDRLAFFFFDSNGALLWRPGDKNIRRGENNQVVIEVPSMELRRDLAGEELSIYVVANLELPTISSLKELLSYSVTSPEFADGGVPQNLIMQGSFQRKIKFVGEGNRLGTLYLKRLAAKIEPKYPLFPEKGIPFYTANGEKEYYQLLAKEDVAVRLEYAYHKTTLDFGKVTENESSNSSKFIRFQEGKHPVFYSYAGNWKEKSPNFLEYRVQLRRSDTGEVGTYYYRVPIAGTDKDNPEGYQQIQSNTHYEITPRIGQLGATTPKEAAMLQATIFIKNWSTKTLLVAVNESHYFMLKEHEVKMSNTDRYAVEFVASSNVGFKIDKVWFSGWKQRESGKKDLIAYEEEIKKHDWRYPRVVVDNHSSPKKIYIESSIPTNLSPKFIQITFKDKNGLEEELLIEQQPSRFIAGMRSDARDKDPSVYYVHDYDNSYNTAAQNNFNLFVVTTLTGGDDFVGKQFKIGDPTYVKDGIIYTHEDREHNQLISPRFVIASQRSIYDRVMYDRDYDLQTPYGPRRVMSAKERCATYAEGGFEKGTWRLPTEAEIEYMKALQEYRESPVKELFRGATYWSAATYRYYIFERGSTYEGEKGPFGNYSTSNDSYEPNPGGFAPVVQGNGYPNSLPFVVEATKRIDYWGQVTARRFYYSSFVRCVRDIY